MPARALANGSGWGVIRVDVPNAIWTQKVACYLCAGNSWRRSYASYRLDGVTTIVEQAPTLPTIKEFLPRDLAESFEAVFVGIDPQDLCKKQTFPISKTLLKQFEFAQRNSKPHQGATCRKADVEDWADGETPDVFQNTYLRALTDTLERLQSWPGCDALQAGWHLALCLDSTACGRSCLVE